jgi:hypothetical protein
MAFYGPNMKGFLGQILRVGFNPGEAQGKSKESLVVIAHNRLEFIG